MLISEAQQVKEDNKKAKGLLDTKLETIWSFRLY
jgi:hypothetical protein